MQGKCSSHKSQDCRPHRTTGEGGSWGQCGSCQTQSLVSPEGVRLWGRGQDLELDPGPSQGGQGQEAKTGIPLVQRSVYGPCCDSGTSRCRPGWRSGVGDARVEQVPVPCLCPGWENQQEHGRAPRSVCWEIWQLQDWYWEQAFRDHNFIDRWVDTGSAV